MSRDVRGLVAAERFPRQRSTWCSRNGRRHTQLAACEAVARLRRRLERPCASSIRKAGRLRELLDVALVGAPRVVLTGSQMAFGYEEERRAARLPALGQDPGAGRQLSGNVSPGRVSTCSPGLSASRRRGSRPASWTRPGRRRARCCRAWAALAGRGLRDRRGGRPVEFAIGDTEESMNKPVVTFGEIMLRLAPPGLRALPPDPAVRGHLRRRRGQRRRLAGRLRLPARYVTVLPANPIARRLRRRAAPLRRRPVPHRPRQGALRHLLRRGRRQPAALEGHLRPRAQRHRAGQARRHRLGRRPSTAPAGSTSPASPRPSARARRTWPSKAVRKAREMGLTVSCDLNYRKNLWKYGKTRHGGDARAGPVRGRRHRQRRGLPEGARHPGGRGRRIRQARGRAVPAAGREGAGRSTRT